MSKGRGTLARLLAGIGSSRTSGKSPQGLLGTRRTSCSTNCGYARRLRRVIEAW